MNGLLVRVGIDQTAGWWNSPVDPKSGRFFYVPIQEECESRKAGLVPRYDSLRKPLAEFGVEMPGHLRGMQMHLDPDFDYLTYGDCNRRAAQICGLGRGDLLAFYAGLGFEGVKSGELVYALIGLYRIHEIVPAAKVPRSRWHENAHTRRVPGQSDDYVVRAIPGQSGRLKRCIPFGEYRDRAYRVRRDILKAWGGLDVNDGYVTRSGYLPSFLDAGRFYTWFKRQRPRRECKNNLPCERSRGGGVSLELAF
jgi:hypothetical protein